MNIVPQFHYALISGPRTGWTTGGTRTGWVQDRQILFEGTERECQGQKNRQQKDDRSTAAASAPDEAKKRLHRREAELQNVSKQPSVPFEESFEGKSSSTTEPPNTAFQIANNYMNNIASSGGYCSREGWVVSWMKKPYAERHAAILQVVYLRRRHTYFSNKTTSVRPRTTDASPVFVRRSLRSQSQRKPVSPSREVADKELPGGNVQGAIVLQGDHWPGETGN
ncbi:unnamed protein product [Sphagnum compactum]